MKSKMNHRRPTPALAQAFFPVLLASTLLLAAQPAAAEADDLEILPPKTTYQGKTYPQWAAAFWKWALELPLDGHPFNDCMKDFSTQQTGNVWYWSAPDGTVSCNETMPEGKAVFLTLRDAETSSLEDPPFYGASEQAQRANSKWLADHIVGLFCLIDGEPVEHIYAYRFLSPQIHFNAPTPWIFGTTGGPGTSVGDGYYLMLEPLSPGRHVIHYGGTFHFNAGELGPDPLDFPKDVTLTLTVGKQAHHDSGPTFKKTQKPSAP